MINAPGVETTRGSPNPARRVVNFGARESGSAAALPSCDKHLAVGQQCRRVLRTRDIKAACISKNISSTALYWHQPCARKKQEKRNSPRKNAGSRRTVSANVTHIA
jgi:hypothetical protein